METDLRDLFAEWPYDPEDTASNFRKIRGEDGRWILQVREPLGIQQMEFDGRPDGFRPEGHETWLECFKHESNSDPEFTLSHEKCLLLMQEGILFYQRYLILYQMEEWAAVVRDTGRNLEYFDFARIHAEIEQDSLTIEQYRPYLMRMNAIARGHLLWQGGENEAAIELLSRTLDRIKALEPVPTSVFSMEVRKATEHIEQQIEAFRKARPESKLEMLNRQKTEAVLREDFELAARLRDQIRMLEGEFIGKN